MLIKNSVINDNYLIVSKREHGVRWEYNGMHSRELAKIKTPHVAWDTDKRLYIFDSKKSLESYIKKVKEHIKKINIIDIDKELEACQVVNFQGIDIGYIKVETKGQKIYFQRSLWEYNNEFFAINEKKYLNADFISRNIHTCSVDVKIIQQKWHYDIECTLESMLLLANLLHHRHYLLQKKLQLFSYGVFPKVLNIPKLAWNQFKHLLNSANIGYADIELFKINDHPKISHLDPHSLHFWENLHPFQQEGVMFCLKNNMRAILGDEMGLGKTIQALAATCLVKKAQEQVLIIVPAIARYVWHAEIIKWVKCNEEEIFHLDSIKNRLIPVEATWIITTYSLIQTKARKEKNQPILEKLLSNMPKHIIFDEAHKLKNKRAKQTQAAMKFITAPNILLITGTPIRNTAKDLSSLLTIIEPSEVANNDYLIKDMINSIMIRRLKKDVLSELPQKRRSWIGIRPSISKEISTYQKAYKEALIEAELTSDEVLKQGFFKKAARANGIIKALSVETLELIEEIVLQQSCCIVFSNHHKVTDILYQKLSQTNTCAIIDGRTALDVRQKIAEHFQAGKINIILGGIHSAGEALTLTRSSSCVFVEMDWVPAAIFQAEDRAHRQGQQANSYNIYHLYLHENELENHMKTVLSKKIEHINYILDEDISFENSSSQKTIMKEVQDAIFSNPSILGDTL